MDIFWTSSRQKLWTNASTAFCKSMCCRWTTSTVYANCKCSLPKRRLMPRSVPILWHYQTVPLMWLIGSSSKMLFYVYICREKEVLKIIYVVCSVVFFNLFYFIVFKKYLFKEKIFIFIFSNHKTLKIPEYRTHKSTKCFEQIQNIFFAKKKYKFKVKLWIFCESCA